jgi:hypothetical protein
LKKTRIKERLENLAVEMAKLAAIEKQVLASPDQQISFTDPDSRSMATSGRGSGIVGYNVQTAVDAESHLIVAHEVTTSGSDRLVELRRRVRVCSMCHAPSASRASSGARRRKPGFEVSWGKAMVSIEERCVAATIATGIVVMVLASWLWSLRRGCWAEGGDG